MNKIKNIYLSYWFSELKDNPSKKVFELEDEIRSIINEPLMYNEDDNHTNLIIPRIQGISTDKKYLFTVSYINAILSINVDNISIDEAILLINNNIQLFYDIIKKIFGVKILYSSIKVEMIDENKKTKDKLIKALKLVDKKYENLTMKQGFIKDNYYINYIMEFSCEYNFNFKEQYSEEDLFNKSMVTSLSEAKLNKEYLYTVIEINDRYSYNQDSNYETNKDELRGMIMELKEILTKELYWKL
jgi:hypothetical protein